MIPYVALSSETISFPQEPNTLSLFYEKVINTFKIITLSPFPLS